MVNIVRYFIFLIRMFLIYVVFGLFAGLWLNRGPLPWVLHDITKSLFYVIVTFFFFKDIILFFFFLSSYGFVGYFNHFMNHFTSFADW